MSKPCVNSLRQSLGRFLSHHFYPTNLIVPNKNISALETLCKQNFTAFNSVFTVHTNDFKTIWLNKNKITDEGLAVLNYCAKKETPQYNVQQEESSVILSSNAYVPARFTAVLFDALNKISVEPQLNRCYFGNTSVTINDKTKYWNYNNIIIQDFNNQIYHKSRFMGKHLTELVDDANNFTYNYSEIVNQLEVPHFIAIHDLLENILSKEMTFTTSVYADDEGFGGFSNETINTVLKPFYDTCRNRLTMHGNRPLSACLSGGGFSLGTIHMNNFVNIFFKSLCNQIKIRSFVEFEYLACGYRNNDGGRVFTRKWNRGHNYSYPFEFVMFRDALEASGETTSELQIANDKYQHKIRDFGLPYNLPEVALCKL